MKRNFISILLAFFFASCETNNEENSPYQDSGITGGNPEMIETIAKAAIATGVDGIFLETHPNPSQSKSDGANMLHLDKLEELLVKLIKIRKVI